MKVNKILLSLLLVAGCDSNTDQWYKEEPDAFLLYCDEGVSVDCLCLTRESPPRVVNGCDILEEELFRSDEDEDTTE